MARVFEWGTAPQAVREGYRMSKVIIGTEAEVTEKYKDRDVVLVYGLPSGKPDQPDQSEFAVYVKGNR